MDVHIPHLQGQEFADPQTRARQKFDHGHISAIAPSVDRPQQTAQFRLGQPFGMVRFWGQALGVDRGIRGHVSFRHGPGAETAGGGEPLVDGGGLGLLHGLLAGPPVRHIPPDDLGRIKGLAVGGLAPLHKMGQGAAIGRLGVDALARPVRVVQPGDFGRMLGLGCAHDIGIQQ